MGIWITAAFLLALAILPLGIHVRYNEAGFLLRVIAGPLKITVFPRKKKPKKQKAKQKKQNAEKSPESTDSGDNPPQPPKPLPEPKEKGGSLTRFLPLVRLGLKFLGDFRRKLRVDNLCLRLILAGDDPCDLALNYGRAWQALANLMPMLDKAFVIGKRDCEVECDFTATETLITAQAELTVRLGQIVWLGAVYGVRLLKELLIFKKKRKGGAVS